jgi:hypothetical protein
MDGRKKPVPKATRIAGGRKAQLVAAMLEQTSEDKQRGQVSFRCSKTAALHPTASAYCHHRVCDPRRPVIHEFAAGGRSWRWPLWTAPTMALRREASSSTTAMVRISSVFAIPISSRISSSSNRLMPSSFIVL